MMAATALTAERVESFEELANALARAGQPTADLLRPGRAFFRFAEADSLIGFGGLEGAAPDILLRSVTVAPAFRGHGRGGRMVAALEREAAAIRAVRLHLLTTNAASFFERQGYAATDRKHAPPSIAASDQFSSLCPSGATYLVKRIAP
jgi:N-acetylglutamate synthase-like GNAT family acetyltransferase